MTDTSNALESLVLSLSCTSKLQPVDIDLPTELVVKILEIAAASSTQTAATLCRVAQWVRDLAVPHLHTICEVGITLDKLALPEFATKMAAGDFLQADRIMKKRELGKFVHALWNHWNGYQLIDFMKVCPNVHHIAFSELPLLVSAVHPHAKFHLTREFLATTHNIHITLFADPGMVGIPLSIRPNSFHALSTFSGLTHFALPYLAELWFISVLIAAATAMETLDCIVVIVDPSVHPATVVLSATSQLMELHKSSPKFLLFQAEITKDADLELNREKLREMWELEVRGGESLWDKARKYTHTLVTP
ncbi:hypothetical protein C8J57DRAFT_1305169 [Mycena rebaudengoi]|nr:hypothetical protein C8J57DRAFT_1305169 [Mycena rebaudengoi]